MSHNRTWKIAAYIAVAALTAFIIWKNSISRSNAVRRPRTPWPIEWEQSQPLPSILLATKEYLRRHGKPPEELADLNFIEVEAHGRTLSGKQIDSRLIYTGAGRNVRYYPSGIRLRSTRDDSHIILAMQDAADDPTKVQLIFLNGSVKTLNKNDALTEADKQSALAADAAVDSAESNDEAKQCSCDRVRPMASSANSLPSGATGGSVKDVCKPRKCHSLSYTKPLSNGSAGRDRGYRIAAERTILVAFTTILAASTA